MADKDTGTIPQWDGSAKTWRKYTREVAWWVQSDKRRYCATKLVSKLTGPARLLAMSWPLASFDSPDGTPDLIRKLILAIGSAGHCQTRLLSVLNTFSFVEHLVNKWVHSSSARRWATANSLRRAIRGATGHLSIVEGLWHSTR